MRRVSLSPRWRWMVGQVSRYVFLAWAGLPLSILIAAQVWFNWTCEVEQVQLLRQSVSGFAEREGSGGWGQAILRLTAASHMSLGVNFALFVASAAVVCICLAIVRRLQDAKGGAVLLACVIAGIGIYEHFRGESCLAQWYFKWWYPPLETLLPTARAVGVVLVFASNLAVAFLVVAVAVHHREATTAREESDIEALIGQLADMRKLLYAAAILFTLGVYAIFYGLYVNVALIPPSQQKTFIDVVANLTFVYGITYTTLLLTAFYPCVARLNARAYALARRHGRAQAPREFFTKHGLDVPSIADLKELLVVLGPLLAGTTAGVLKGS